MKDREKILESVSPDGKWTIIVEWPFILNRYGEEVPAYGVEFFQTNHPGRKTYSSFGYDAPPEQMTIDWNLPDSVLGIFLSRKCYLLFRWGARDWRARTKSRIDEEPSFTAEEIAWFCAKQEVNSNVILEYDQEEFAYLIVKRYEALYKEFAQDPRFNTTIYALPAVGTDGRDRLVRYHGLDRDPIFADNHTEASAAEKRMAEIGEYPRWVFWGLLRLEDVTDVLKLAEAAVPGEYEPVWVRLAGSVVTPPKSYRLIGYEPSWFPGGFFSPLCDCMCFPRWHGTDPEGILFSDYFKRINNYGLFDTLKDADEFLTYYVSFDWTEEGGYTIIEVWIPDGIPEK